MSCEQFEAEMREVAATADAPRGGLHDGETSSGAALLRDCAVSQGRPPRKAAAPTALLEHLDGCASCRQSYDAERSLFAAIDGELARVANGEVGPSFLPRVRAAIEVERAAGDAVRPWFVLWPVACAMAVCVALVIFQRVHLGPQVAPPFAASASGPSSAENSATSGIAGQTAGLQRQTVHKSLPVVRAPHGVVATAGDEKRKAQRLEVLVPPDERLALARFLVVLEGQRETAMALTKPAPEIATVDLASEPLEIAELQVAPLSPRQDE
ncbi:MAG: hypothetical protein ABSG69_16275 [Candidatus Acidiferrum sp.]|jgi:hypothetical protein